MKEKSISILHQGPKDTIDIRLSIINKSLSEYASLNNIPATTLKKDVQMIESEGSKSFFYGDDLIVMVSDSLSYNGVSFVLEYSLNDILEAG